MAKVLKGVLSGAEGILEKIPKNKADDVYYHGTFGDFDEFELGHQRSAADNPSDYFSFTDKESIAKAYAPGGEVKKVSLSIEKPLDLTNDKAIKEINEAIEDGEISGIIHGERPTKPLTKDNLWAQIEDMSDPNDFMNGVAEWAKDNGYDGMRFMDFIDGEEHLTQAVFSPSQIKSIKTGVGDFSGALSSAAPISAVGALAAANPSQSTASELVKSIPPYYESQIQPGSMRPQIIESINGSPGLVNAADILEKYTASPLGGSHFQGVADLARKWGYREQATPLDYLYALLDIAP